MARVLKGSHSFTCTAEDWIELVVRLIRFGRAFERALNSPISFISYDVISYLIGVEGAVQSVVVTSAKEVTCFCSRQQDYSKVMDEFS